MTSKQTLNIIARKPRDNGGMEFVVIDRGGGRAAGVARFISATVNALSLSSGEWFWGHYFATQVEALAHFNAR